MNLLVQDVTPLPPVFGRPALFTYNVELSTSPLTYIVSLQFRPKRNICLVMGIYHHCIYDFGKLCPLCNTTISRDEESMRCSSASGQAGVITIQILNKQREWLARKGIEATDYTIVV